VRKPVFLLFMGNRSLYPFWRKSQWEREREKGRSNRKEEAEEEEEGEAKETQMPCKNQS